MKKQKQRKGPDPPPADLSPAAMRRAVWRATYDNLTTLGPMGIGILAGAWALLIEPSLLAMLIAASGLAAGGASTLANLFLLGDRHAGRYLQQMNEILAQERQVRVEALQADLIACGTRVKGVDELVEQSSTQASQVLERNNRIREVLAEKLAPGELAFGRFAGTTEQVSLAILDNLQRVLHLLQSLPADANATRRRLEELGRIKRPQEPQSKEIGALTERVRLYDEQLRKVRAILAQNEEALTELDRATAALAEAETSRGQAGVGLEDARSTLEELIDRVKSFSVD